jgi:hypothetical protein
MDHGLERVGAGGVEKKDFGGCPGLAHTEESGADHACCVYDERIFGLYEIREVAESVMGDRLGVSAHDHQPTRVARLDGVLRDAFCRQDVVVV